jgi:1-acyl-sn-glycerol-3-phosphate acyltransferase
MMYYLRMLTMLLGFLVSSGYGITAALVRRNRSRVAYDYARLLGRLTRRPLGARQIEIHGEANLHRHRPCIYIANHQSYFDVPMLASVYPEDTVVIAKKEIRSVPLFGWLFVRTGNILIDRSNRKQAVGQLKEVSEEMRRRNVSVWIFPEGTRGKEPGELLPFKKGAFQMAIAAQCPLVPVVLAPLRPVIDTHERKIRPGTLEIHVLDPIPTDGLTEADLEALIDEAHRRMQGALSEIAARQGLLVESGGRSGERAGGK